MTEGQLQDAIRLALGRDPEILLYRNNCGVLTDAHSNRRVRFGVGNPGGADLIGIFRGRFVALEIKTTAGRQSEDQRRFQNLVTQRGGIYAVVHSVEEAQAWLSMLRQTIQ